MGPCRCCFPLLRLFIHRPMHPTPCTRLPQTLWWSCGWEICATRPPASRCAAPLSCEGRGGRCRWLGSRGARHRASKLQLRDGPLSMPWQPHHPPLQGTCPLLFHPPCLAGLARCPASRCTAPRTTAACSTPWCSCRPRARSGRCRCAQRRLHCTLVPCCRVYAERAPPCAYCCRYPHTRRCCITWPRAGAQRPDCV